MTDWLRFRILELLERVEGSDADKALLYEMWLAATYRQRLGVPAVERCPTCGSGVRVQHGDDGTHWFEPMAGAFEPLGGDEDASAARRRRGA